MTEHKSSVAEAADPKRAKRVSAEEERTAAQIAEEIEKLAEERARFREHVSEEELNLAKLRLYEDFVKGRITRGRLDRELDAIYTRRHEAEELLQPDPPKTARQPEADKIVKTYVWWSAGSGLIPFPVVDLMALSGVQVLMVRKLCDFYEVPFSEQWGKSLVGALVGGLTPSYLKSIPGIGTAIGIVTSPAANAGSTYAVGKVFVQHFESGGTLLTFDPAKMKGYFKDYYEKGRHLANHS